MISYKNSWLSFKKTDVVNNDKDILLRFTEKICPAVHMLIANFFCLRKLVIINLKWAFLTQLLGIQIIGNYGKFVHIILSFILFNLLYFDNNNYGN